MIVVLEYVDISGRSPFGRWFDSLESGLAGPVSAALVKIRLGNDSNCRVVGGGVTEFKINFGPGLCVYFGRDGSEIVVLLGGGSKKRQQKDIDLARERWADFKRRKSIGDRDATDA